MSRAASRITSRPSPASSESITPAFKRPLMVILAIGLITPFLGGCYTYARLTPTTLPEPGEEVALEISDAGRVQLGDRFGAGLLRVEGRLTSAPEDTFALRVHEVYAIGRPAVRWNGELAHIDRNFVSSVEVRRFSRARTALTAGAITVGLVAAFITSDLFGFSEGGGRARGPSGPVTQRAGQ